MGLVMVLTRINLKNTTTVYRMVSSCDKLARRNYKCPYMIIRRINRLTAKLSFNTNKLKSVLDEEIKKRQLWWK
jgi:hypothetical protein